MATSWSTDRYPRPPARRATRRSAACGTIVVALLLLAASPSPAGTADGDTAAIRETIRRYYAAYSARDTAAYRAMLAGNYLLLENGEIMDASADIAAMPLGDTTYRRSDQFEFRAAEIGAELASIVYVLTSDIRDRNGERHRTWLESAVLRRSATGWKVAILHSTRIGTGK